MVFKGNQASVKQPTASTLLRGSAFPALLHQDLGCGH